VDSECALKILDEAEKHGIFYDEKEKIFQGNRKDLLGRRCLRALVLLYAWKTGGTKPSPQYLKSH